ncbi:MAG: hypothetical protein V2B19_03635 [Pseudomonadota bacterium]
MAPKVTPLKPLKKPPAFPGPSQTAGSLSINFIISKGFHPNLGFYATNILAYAYCAQQQ